MRLFMARGAAEAGMPGAPDKTLAEAAEKATTACDRQGDPA